jgi:hypothetical protein
VDTGVGDVVAPRGCAGERFLKGSAVFDGMDRIKGGGGEGQMVSGASMGVGQDYGGGGGWGGAHMGMPVYLPQVAGVGRGGDGAGGWGEGGGGAYPYGMGPYPYGIAPSVLGLEGGLYSSPLHSAPSLSAPAGAAAVCPAVDRDARRAEDMTTQKYSTLDGSSDGAQGGGRVDPRKAFLLARRQGIRALPPVMAPSLFSGPKIRISTPQPPSSGMPFMLYYIIYIIYTHTRIYIVTYNVIY